MAGVSVFPKGQKPRRQQHKGTKVKALSSLTTAACRTATVYSLQTQAGAAVG